MISGLTVKQTKFVTNLTNTNLTQEQAAIKAGYSPRNSDVISSQLLRNHKIIDALERAGISDRFISSKLKRNIQKGSKLDVTPDVYMRSLDLVTKLKGYQQGESKEQNVSQTNIYINELKAMSNDELQAEVDTLVSEVSALKKQLNEP